MVPSILKDHTEHAKDWNPSTESFFEIANLDYFWTTEVKRCFSIFPFTRVEVKATVGKAASLNSEQDTAENHPCTHSTFRIEPLPFFISLFLTQQSDGDWMQTYSGKHDLSNQPTWTWMRSTQMRLYIQLCNLWHLLAVQPAIFFFCLNRLQSVKNRDAQKINPNYTKKDRKKTSDICRVVTIWFCR